MSLLPHPGAETSLVVTPLGHALSTHGRRERTHAWQTTPMWDDVTGQWVATVRAGTVSGRTPVVRLQAPAKGEWEWATNPLTGKPFKSSSPVRGVADVPLYLGPQIPLTWRALGYDGDGTVPQFFRDRGAIDSSTASAEVASPEQLAAGVIAERPPGLRLLRACDIWIHQPRPALQSTVVQGSGLTDGTFNWEQQLYVGDYAPGDVLCLIAGQFEPAPFGLVNPLTSNYQESAYDELKVCTVYALSPEGAAAGSEPDASWETFVEHALFFNLDYEPAPSPWYQDETGFLLFVPLAGGAGQVIINSFTSTITDAQQQALNYIQGSSLAGTFWSPTGAGTTSAVPAAPAAAPRGRTGTDKSGRIAAAALAEAYAVNAAQLDPAWPYNARPLTPEALLSFTR